MGETSRPSERDIVLNDTLQRMVLQEIEERTAEDPDNNPLLNASRKVLEGRLEELSDDEREILEEAKQRELRVWEAQEEARRHKPDATAAQPFTPDEDMRRILDEAWRTVEERRAQGKDILDNTNSQKEEQ